MALIGMFSQDGLLGHTARDLSNMFLQDGLTRLAIVTRARFVDVAGSFVD